MLYFSSNLVATQDLTRVSHMIDRETLGRNRPERPRPPIRRVVLEPRSLKATLRLASKEPVHTLRGNTSVLLNTYLGARTGRQVLNGLTQRGDGESIHAVIWFCDLRDSTAMADTMPSAQFLEDLNLFFDSVAGAVLERVTTVKYLDRNDGNPNLFLLSKLVLSKNV